MKNLIALAFLVCFGLKASATVNKINFPQEKTTEKKDCVLMVDGQMYVVKDGAKTEMTKAMTMANGTKVLANGEVFLKDGETFKLADGDCVYTSGKVEKKKPA